MGALKSDLESSGRQISVWGGADILNDSSIPVVGNLASLAVRQVGEDDDDDMSTFTLLDLGIFSVSLSLLSHQSCTIR